MAPGTGWSSDRRAVTSGVWRAGKEPGRKPGQLDPPPGWHPGPGEAPTGGRSPQVFGSQGRGPVPNPANSTLPPDGTRDRVELRQAGGHLRCLEVREGARCQTGPTRPSPRMAPGTGWSSDRRAVTSGVWRSGKGPGRKPGQLDPPDGTRDRVELRQAGGHLRCLEVREGARSADRRPTNYERSL